MKITLERMREIITEEVIKEAVEPEDAQRTIVALLQGTAQNVTGDIMGAVYDEMYASDVAEPSPEQEEENFPTEYQPGGAYGDRPEIRLGRRAPVNEIIQQELALVLVEGLDALLNEKFQDPGGEADPDSHWGQERQKEEEAAAWAAGAEDRAKEKKKHNQWRADRELENKLGDYIWMLKKFTENATTLKGRFGSSNIMRDIVSAIEGRIPFSKANISNIDRRKVTELGDLIRALVKPYSVARDALASRDYEIHQARSPGPEKTRAQKERDQYESDMFLASHGFMQENSDIEIVDD
jgi:hypothetical protein